MMQGLTANSADEEIHIDDFEILRTIGEGTFGPTQLEQLKIAIFPLYGAGQMEVLGEYGWLTVTMSAEEDAKWLQWVTHHFETIAGEDREINLQELKRALNVKESFFAKRFFILFDSDGSGTITLQELQEAWTLLTHGSPTDKLQFLFQVRDVDGSGSINVDELRIVLQSCLRESAISLPEEKQDQLTLALFKLADKDCSGVIPFDELRDELQRFPGVMENLTISAAHWLTPSAARPPRHRPRQLTSAYHSHHSHLPCLAAYVGLHVLLFALAASARQALGASVMVAKGCGQCLNFDCSFIKVFYWTHLSYLPCLHGPNLWKWLLVPGTLFFLEKAVGLAASRMEALCIVEVNLLPSKVTHLLIRKPPLFHYRPGDYLYLNIPTIAHHEWHPFTISSAPEQKDTIWLHIRSQGQWTNRLYESFKKSDPVGCGSERLSRSLKMRRSQRKPQGLQPQPIYFGASAQGAVASNKDVSVELMSYRPKGTPQQEDEGLVYVGTKDGLQAQWEAAAEDLGRVSEVSSENHRFCTTKCCIDGPYGTPNRRIFASEHAVLIGAGVGITPFASILQSILYRHQKRRHICPNCQHSGREGVPDADRKLLKVDFIWINRGRSFEWFVSLLTRLEMDQAEETQEVSIVSIVGIVSTAGIVNSLLA
ncbi:LOW QUALITY PROTEIN: NADPH oxidase 5-like [Megaptera novaeangliae]